MCLVDLYDYKSIGKYVYQNVSNYSGRIWRLRVIKCRWFVFSRRRCHTLPILLAARFAGKMADACPVCLYKQETSSRGITFICAPFFC